MSDRIFHHTAAPICPHCGYAERDAWEIDFSSRDTTTIWCESCGGEYLVTQHIEITYSTRKP